MTDSPMKMMITRLLDDATTMDDNPLVKALRDAMPANAQPKFLECQLALKGGYAVAGVLTRVGYPDVLRLVSPAKKPDNSVIMADHYFDYDDVLTIMIGRDLPRSAIQQPRNGSPIILGH